MPGWRGRQVVGDLDKFYEEKDGKDNKDNKE